MKVAELMSTPVHCITSDKSVRYASERMSKLGVGSLLVMEMNTIRGILTSRDIRAVHPNRIVADAMTPEPVSVTSDCFVWDALTKMESRHIERLPVMDGTTVVGMITRESIKVKMSEMLDVMTGLYRAPYIEMIGNDLIRKGTPFHLLFIDLNHFGKINKRYGHSIGDAIITGFVKRLRMFISKHDYLCRYAGDEFVIVSLREESHVQALTQSLIETVYIQDIQVSAAVGRVSYPEFIEDGEDLFRSMLNKASLMSTLMKQTG